MLKTTLIVSSVVRGFYLLKLLQTNPIGKHLCCTVHGVSYVTTITPLVATSQRRCCFVGTSLKGNGNIRKPLFFSGEFEGGVFPPRMTEWRIFKCPARLVSSLSTLSELQFIICVLPVLRYYILEFEGK